MKLNYKRTILVGFAFFLISAFWQAYTSGNMNEAIALVEKYDIALFADLIGKNGMDFSAAIQGMYETAGVGSRWRRFPYSSLTDAQMEKLKAFLQERELTTCRRQS